MTSTTERSTSSHEAPAPARPRVRWQVFIPAAIATLIITLWAFLRPEHAKAVLGSVVGWTAGWFGWFYVALVAAVLVFVIYLALSRYGHIKLGPEHSKPEFSLMSWASMLFAAGISTDLMFFAVSEPVTQYLHPPSTQPETVQAARESTAWTLFHYGISGWGLYALMGMALAYFAYRKNMPLAIRSALAPIFGRRVQGTLGHTVDFAALLGTIFGVATSLGIGVVMVNVGLHSVFGLPVGTSTQVAIVAIGVAIATLSAVSGVDKGIKFLSLLNVFLALGLTLWILLTGKTQYLLEGLVLNIGDFFKFFPDMIMQTFPYQDTGTWMSDWTLFFWAWWIAWASFVGLFLARISRGRTIRQFVLGTLSIPFIYILMWVSIYGNAALDVVRGGDDAFGEQTVNNPETAFYELLSNYPGFVFVAALATLTALLFYVTSADSASLVMANLSSELPTPQHDGRPSLRIFWAVATGALTIAVLIVGGVGALQSATVIMGLPFAFVILLVMVGLFRSLRVETFRLDSAQQTLAGSLSGRTGPRRDDKSWRRRLTRVLSFPNLRRTRDFEDRILLPALEEVAAELRNQGVEASAGPLQRSDDSQLIQLEVAQGGENSFHYQVWRREVAVPSVGPVVPRGTDQYYRLEVYVDGGTGQGYDIMGYTSQQIIEDVLDQYERHLAFLQIHQNSLDGAV
ncbi:MAG TPA: choline BCCT transporter BetT [Ruania sp.]|nr:choline BCCT transporter BetT [Ruania sp.]